LLSSLSSTFEEHMTGHLTRSKLGRRQWLVQAGKTSAAAVGMSLLPASIQRALAVPAARVTGTIEDVEHVVILMQENRSFDHYFGTMSGVRGFADRTTPKLPSGKDVWWQSDGKRELVPFHLDTHSTQAMRVPGTPHSWSDAQSAWAEGRIHEWPRYKRFQSMGYYEADDIPFQRALAEAFTVCDAHHCSIQSGTLANRVVFMTGTNVRPGLARPAVDQSEAVINNANNRGQDFGRYTWTTYPERLEAAGVSWRVYQNPDDNWNGVLAPWESFDAFAAAGPGDPLHEKAKRHWSLDDLRRDVQEGTLPQVSWIIPSPVWSEHPSASSPLQGASYTQQVLDCLVSKPEVWSRCVFIVTFDENDGFFDHVPPPAVPSIIGPDGELAGKTTLEGSIAEHYYTNSIDEVTATRPYGMGPRVPMYLVSPWSRGGWVCSETFDHTSTIRFLEARFGVSEPNISAWHRAVSGDLTRCFDFANPSAEQLPVLPDMSYATGETLVIEGLPEVRLPDHPRVPEQDPGMRYSRRLPYQLSAELQVDVAQRSLQLQLESSGEAGAVFHVYDNLHLDRVPRRYTVEAGKSLADGWPLDADGGSYDLHILGPGGFLRQFAGQLPSSGEPTALPEARLVCLGAEGCIEVHAWNQGAGSCVIKASPNAYRSDRPFSLELHAEQIPRSVHWNLQSSGYWYDFSITCPALPGWLRRFAGRLETGRDGLTDPALGPSGRT
jgi:phospholipase C